MAWPAALRIRFNNAGLPGWEDRFIRYGWPFARRYVKHVLDIRPGIEAEDEAAVFGGGLRLRRGAAPRRSPYLCGECFSASTSTWGGLTTGRYGFSRTGSVFSWLRNSDSANAGAPSIGSRG